MNSRPSEPATGPAPEAALPPLTIDEVNPLEIADWDTAIAALPGATFFHTRAWAAVLHEAYGFVPRYLVASAGPATLDGAATTPSRLRLPAVGDATTPSRIPFRPFRPFRPSPSATPPTRVLASPLLGVLPLMVADSWLTGRRGVALPFTDACAPIADEPEISRQLVRAAMERGRRDRWRYCEVRDGGAGVGAPASLTFYGHTVDLRPGVHLLWVRLPTPVCRAIRKAEGSGLKIEFTTSREGLAAFYDLLCRTRRRHGVPPQPRRFFDAIHRHVLETGHGLIVLARRGTQPLAGAVYFHFGRTAVYKFGASDERFLHLRPNNLVMARAMEHYAQHGFETLDLGRTSLSNDGLRRFKEHWNAEERLIEYIRYDCRHDRFVTTSDSAEGWHTVVFRHLPLPVSRLLGTLLYPHMA